MSHGTKSRIRGLVMEVGESHAILATPDMAFHRLPLSRLPRGIREGEEIWFRPEGARQRSLTRQRIAATVAVCLAASLIFFMLSVPLLRDLMVDRHVAAHLVVDINPSVEMTVSRGGHVIDAWGLNDRGQDMVHNIRWRNRHVLEVLEALVREAAASGYLDPSDPDGTILISLIATDPDEEVEGFLRAAEISQFVSQSLGGMFAGDARPVVKAWDVSQEERQEADDLNMSPNRYLVLKGLERAGLEIEPQELEGRPLGHIIRDQISPHGISVPDFIKGRDDRPGPPEWAPDPPGSVPGPPEDPKQPGDTPGPPGSVPGPPEDPKQPGDIPGPPVDVPGKPGNEDGAGAPGQGPVSPDPGDQDDDGGPPGGRPVNPPIS